MVEKLQTVLILKVVPDTSFARAETMSALVDTDLLLMMKTVTETNAGTYFRSSHDFNIEFSKRVIGLKD